MSAARPHAPAPDQPQPRTGRTADRVQARSSRARPIGDEGLESFPERCALPIRTCVGCRQRAAKSELLRIVARDALCVPDPAGRLPGRGCYLHPRLECFDLADRRRAFARALRVRAGLCADPIRSFIARDESSSERSDPPVNPKAGRTR